MLIPISTALSSACLTVRRISGQHRIAKCVASKASCALHDTGPGWEAWCSLALSGQATRQLYGGASFFRRRRLITMALNDAQPSCTGKTRQYPDEPRVSPWCTIAQSPHFRDTYGRLWAVQSCVHSLLHSHWQH